jgi:hypothetical protein
MGLFLAGWVLQNLPPSSADIIERGGTVNRIVSAIFLMAWCEDIPATYRVSHNTWDYKNVLGRPLNDNIESWEVSHFEAKGVRWLWCVDFFVIAFSKNPTISFM